MNEDNTNKKLIEKMLANLDKICVDPVGNFANSAAVEKNWTWGEYYCSGEAEKHGQYKLKIENDEEINLREFLNFDTWKEDYQKIREAIISNIKQNPSEWEIHEDNSPQKRNFIRNKKSGLKYYKQGLVFYVEENVQKSKEKGERKWIKI